jgi:hypothetical protein
MYKIYKFNDIDFTKINYDKPIDSSLLSPKEYKKGFSIIYVDYENNPLLIELPSLLLKLYNNDNKTLLLSLKSKENKYDNALNDFFYELDKNIITNVFKILKSQKIKTKDLNYITVLQTNDLNEKYIKLKVAHDTKLYNVNKQLVKNDTYKNIIFDKSYIGSIIQIVSILFNHEVIFVNIKLHQLRISYHSPKQILLSEYSFNDSDHELLLNETDNITDSYINTNIKSNKVDDETNNDKINFIINQNDNNEDELNDADELTDEEEVNDDEDIYYVDSD